MKPFVPMPLERRAEPFNDPRWLYELRWDGLRSLAFVVGGGSRLVSVEDIADRRFDDLAGRLSFELRADDAVLDGEIVTLDEATGRPRAVDLRRGPGPCTFVAFDVLAVARNDVRELPLWRRKKLLRAMVPAGARSVVYAEHVDELGCELFQSIRAQHLAGIIAKRRAGIYGNPLEPWFEIRNPDDPQAGDGATLSAR